MSDSKFLRGTLIVTLGTFLVKFLGMIYVFPFHALVGTEGGTLYTYGYIPYTIFLSIATAGVPLAVSKFVSKYNALGDYKNEPENVPLGNGYDDSNRSSFVPSTVHDGAIVCRSDAW